MTTLFRVHVCAECRPKHAPACKTPGCWHETTTCAQCEIVVFKRQVDRKGLCFRCWTHTITG